MRWETRGEKSSGRRWSPEEVEERTPRRDAAYALCNAMYRTKTCSCQSRSLRPCTTMRRGVEVVLEKTGGKT